MTACLFPKLTIFINLLQNEMASLKADNQRLQKLVGPGLSDENARAHASAVEKHLSIGDPGPALGNI